MVMNEIFLKGEKVVLRRVVEEDYPTFLRWLNDPEIRVALTVRYPVDVAYLKNRLAEGVYLSIIFEDKLAGYVALKDINQLNQRAYLETVVGGQHRRRGVGKDALITLLNYAFEELNLHKVLLEVYEFNQTAYELYKKVGFVLEGRLRQNSYKLGKFYDLLIMGMLREEFNNPNNI
ncbi:MAG: putative ribosomal N-acetyltransferase YdaF [candidate division WS2 bacterium]|nr:putative ribosomal N-acetyltransferase YdaF [Candidatus Psychracetigena formicireducens]